MKKVILLSIILMPTILFADCKTNAVYLNNQIKQGAISCLPYGPRTVNQNEACYMNIRSNSVTGNSVICYAFADASLLKNGILTHRGDTCKIHWQRDNSWSLAVDSCTSK